MSFTDFILNNQAYVISYDVDLYLEDMGFDFKLDRYNIRKYFKIISMHDKNIMIEVGSDEKITITRIDGECLLPRVILPIKEKITVELLDSDRFLKLLEDSIYKYLLIR